MKFMAISIFRSRLLFKKLQKQLSSLLFSGLWLKIAVKHNNSKSNRYETGILLEEIMKKTMKTKTDYRFVIKFIGFL